MVIAVAEQKIPVLEDPECQLAMEWRPDVVVDAIIAKKNLGTTIRDAKIVIGVGPGFTAGADCHCVVETKRAGLVIWWKKASWWAWQERIQFMRKFQE